METFTINKETTKKRISWDEVDRCIDVYNESRDITQCEFEYNTLVIYVLQLMYASGKRETTSDEVVDKINNLCNDKIYDHLVKEELIEVYLDENGEEYFDLTEFGEAVAKEMEEND